MQTTDLYERFNRGLLEMRESFHRTGRLDDSNTKLDEIVKLLSIEVAQLHGIPKGLPTLSEVLEKYRFGKISSLVKALNEILELVASSPLFQNSNGESLLGINPRLSISESDNSIAEQLVALVVTTFNGSLRNSNSRQNLELLNEAFGHFVRDNFRNNIEDAQYMTPPEVVTFMCRVAAEEIKGGALSGKKTLCVADPSCGVGSFLAQFYNQLRNEPEISSRKLTLVGQDKVDRMARLSKLNLLLFKSVSSHVHRGNSLVGDSPLDAYVGECDLILTNPPFGARFPARDLRSSDVTRYPLLFDIIQNSNSTIDSELLFLDRYYSLLKPGGIVLAVLPDAVISAGGLPAIIRQRVANHFSIRSITELPAVTFGQAGTRTKTCVLHLQKKPASQETVFMASAKNVGFEVSSRKGVPVKRLNASNDLELIADAFQRFLPRRSKSKGKALSEAPSCVAVLPKALQEEGWTPNHHSAVRYKTLAALATPEEDSDYNIVRLRELVVPLARTRGPVQQNWDTLLEPTLTLRVCEENEEWSESKCISVLHVGDFGFLNIRELLNYRPKYPGQPCRAGDVLFSKINPRIPRVLVVPKLPVPLTCSTEFEVLRAKPEHSPFTLALLLLSSFAQNQILSLTSGTSSSHNRVKATQLLDIRLPLPRPKSKAEKLLKVATETFEEAQHSLHQAAYDSYKSLLEFDKLLLAMVS